MFIPNLDQSYFELFESEESFFVDNLCLDSRFRELQNEFHPDRFAGGTDRQKRASLQFSSFLNEAYQALKHPLPRALYLLQLKGIDVENYARHNTDPSFLMQQIEMREKLEGIGSDEDQLELFLTQVMDQYDATVSSVAACFDLNDWEKAAVETVKLQFLDKLRLEAEELEAELDY
jgi:molecular chaperone HscB